MPKKAVIFDLDGTLLDTIRDIADSANAALLSMGYPEHPTASFREYVGDGARGLAARTLPREAVTEQRIDTFVERYRSMYEARWNAFSKPFVGIPELLDELSARDISLAVLSNKRDEFTKKCVAGLLNRWTFAIVRGERAGVPLKPDPTALVTMAGELGMDCSKCHYVGDSEIDIATAKAAGMIDVGVAWGFRERSDLLAAGASHIIEKPLELLAILGIGE